MGALDDLRRISRLERQLKAAESLIDTLMAETDESLLAEIGYLRRMVAEQAHRILTMQELERMRWERERVSA